MKKIIILLMMLGTGITLAGCGEDELRPESVFGNETEEFTGFDLWLDQNFRAPYNIRLEHRWKDKESDINYNLLPCDPKKAYQLARLIQYVWLDAYVEVAGLDFIRQYSPRVLYFVGSPAYKTATIILGTAEAGKKVVLYNVNNFNAEEIAELNASYFRTMHHEFAHILHQTKNYDPEFGNVTANDYIGSSWSNRNAAEAAELGFVTPYAGAEPDEDFVETVANYLVRDDAWWANLYNQAGETGWALIERKFEIVKKYMTDNWDIDLVAFRSIIQRRGNEIKFLDLEYPFGDL